MTNKKIVIIGMGIAGVSAARSARSAHPFTKISMISKDPYGFYNRIALNAFVISKRTIDEMYFYRQDWLKELRIELFDNTSVQSIDKQERSVLLSGKTTLLYDTLIIATGATPVMPPIPGIDNSGVYSVWDLETAIRLRTVIQNKTNVVIIGGGILGVEAALDIASLGKNVTIVEGDEHLLPKQLTSSLSGSLKNMIEHRNIRVLTNNTITEISKNSTGFSLHRDHNTSLLCDTVLVTTGVKPNDELAADAGIECDNGILVNEKMQTGDEHIYACGNCTNTKQLIPMLWNPAMEQGSIAGANTTYENVTQKRDVFPVHLKNKSLPVFTCGDPESVTTGGTIVEQTGVTDGVSWHKLLFINLDGHIKYAGFIGNTEGCYEVEQAIKKELKVSLSGMSSTSVDEIVETFTGTKDNSKKGWVCQMCGYTHEGEGAPDICPVCHVGKDQFLVA